MRNVKLSTRLQGKQHLAAGRIVTIFAEGTRSRDGAVHRFRSGAFELALQAGVDVLPVRLTGSQWCTPRGRLDIGDFDVSVHVLPRVSTVTFDKTDPTARIELGRRVRRDIEAGFTADDRTGQSGPSVWRRVAALYRYQGPYVEMYLASKLRFDSIYKAIDALVPAEGLVVDAGCGYGLMSNILSLRSRGRRVVGFDRDEAKLAVAQRAGRFVPAATFVCGDLRSWPVSGADAALMIDVLHYWAAPRQRELIAEAARNLRPGGRLIFRDNLSPGTPGTPGSENTRVQSPGGATSGGGGANVWARLGEIYSLMIGHNLRGDGLVFLPRETYVQWFAQAGLRRVDDMEAESSGSKLSGELPGVMVFEKGAM